MQNNTLYASELAYEFETMRIELGTERGVVREVRYKLGDSYPSHLEYLDMDYESWTGTSGVAFRDKRTGEIIIAYTGTNPNLVNLSWEQTR